jgi:hypothetical protein
MSGALVFTSLVPFAAVLAPVVVAVAAFLIHVLRRV